MRKLWGRNLCRKRALFPKSYIPTLERLENRSLFSVSGFVLQLQTSPSPLEALAAVSSSASLSSINLPGDSFKVSTAPVVASSPLTVAVSALTGRNQHPGQGAAYFGWRAADHDRGRGADFDRRDTGDDRGRSADFDLPVADHHGVAADGDQRGTDHDGAVADFGRGTGDHGGVTSPPMEVSPPLVVISRPPVESSTPASPPVESSTPAMVVISNPPVVVGSPPVVGSSPPVESSTPATVVGSSPPVESSTPATVVGNSPPVVISTPAVKVNSPPVVVSTPAVEVNTPPTVAASSRAAEYGDGGEGAVDAEYPSPEPSGLLADFLPFDPATMNLALRQFLDQINNLNGELGSFVEGLGLSPWFVVAAAVATTASEITRRRLRRTQDQLSATGCEGATSTWFPDLILP
jgi:hypothetical protein